MTPDKVLIQLQEIYSRMISCSLSMRQNFPSIKNHSGEKIEIGSLQTTGFALKNVAYEEIYQELDANNAYHMKLPDGGLLIFQYFFENRDLLKHRLAFFPSADLPTYDEAPHLYENDALFGDVTLTRLVRFPIRVDYDPLSHKDVLHPKCHLSLGQFDGCRIPVAGPIMPNTFLMFLLRNFYTRAYLRNKNNFDKKTVSSTQKRTITLAECKISHFVMS